MSSQATVTRVRRDWIDEDEDFLEVPSPLERVEHQPATPRKLARDLVREGLAEEIIDEVAGLLESVYRFHPSVSFGDDGRVYLWLPELSLEAEGEDFDEAAADLVSEVLQYVDEWDRGLSGAPNHVPHRGWVRVIQLNRAPDRVYRLLFGE